MSTVYADQWEKPEVRDVTLNDDEGACELAFSDADGWEETITFDSPATLRTWLAAVNQAAEWYLIGREPEAAPVGSAPTCICSACQHARLTQLSWPDNMRYVMALCPTCGNKRCPAAGNHRNECSGSNEPGQPGSAYVL